MTGEDWTQTGQSAKGLMTERVRALDDDPDAAEYIRGQVETFKQVAAEVLSECGYEPKDWRRARLEAAPGSKEYYAANLKYHADRVTKYLASYERDPSRHNVHWAVHEALVAGWMFAALQVAGAEGELHLGMKLLPPLRQRQTSSNRKRQMDRAPEWQSWQAEAEKIWSKNPELSDSAVARKVKVRLELSEHYKTVARNIRNRNGRA